MTWLARFLRKRQQDAQLDSEVDFHIEQQTAENIASGMNRAEARRQALAQFGGLESRKEEAREVRGTQLLESLWQDIRYGIRMLAKCPGFTAIAILTLALGIGANTAIFSLINAVMLKTLPVKNPSQLVLLKWDDNKKWPPKWGQTGWDSAFSFSYPAFEEFRANGKSLSSVFAWVPLGFTSENTTVGIDGTATVADGQMVTGEYFSGLGVTPLLGRGITEADEDPAAPRVAVLSYAYWVRRFASDPSAVGRSIALNGIPFTIVGVTPMSFYGVQVGTEPDLWIPFGDNVNLRPWGTSPSQGVSSVFAAPHWLCVNIMGRLAPGVTREQARSELGGIFHQIVTADWHPDKPEQVPTLSVAPASQGLPTLQQGNGSQLYILMIAVGMVLLIACANVATLLLARATARKKEISVRLAIGASRGRLIRQLLAESVLMATIGGALGLIFAKWSTNALVALMAGGNALVLDANTDSRVLLFTFAAAVLTGIVFGLAPAFRLTRIELASAMKGSATNISDERDRHLLGKSLIAAQVAASVILMIGAGLFVRTLVNFEKNNFGFSQQNLLTFGLDPTHVGYHEARLITFYSQLLDRVQSLPGVQAATLMAYAPFSGWSNNTSIVPEGAQIKPGNGMRWQPVGPDFFQAMHIPILLGRGINRTDTAASPDVAVVDETFAKKYFPKESPIGHRFSQGSTFDPKNAWEIIGVSKTAELTDPAEEPRPKAFMAYAQEPKGIDQMFFEVRTQGSPAAVISELRDAVRQADPAIPMTNLKTQQEETSEALSQQRLFAQLTSVFGLIALLLAMIGLYGTMAYSVTRKTHEIGIRMALGANPRIVLRMVIAQGIRLALIGVVIGIAGAVGVTRLINSMIFGVAAIDPLTFSVVALVLVLVAALACFVPARRAMRVDPMVALRYE